MRLLNTGPTPGTWFSQASSVACDAPAHGELVQRLLILAAMPAPAPATVRVEAALPDQQVEPVQQAQRCRDGVSAVAQHRCVIRPKMAAEEAAAIDIDAAACCP